jgi:surface polysaccharide O-acyltransferase-like enzyme
MMQHYNNPMIGGAIRVVNPASLTGNILGILQVAMICAVDLFILISGYFMRDSKKRDLLKPVKLLMMLLVFELLFFVIQVPLQGVPVDLNTLLRYFTPNYWFIIVYIALYLISPFINLAWENLSRKNRKILVLLSVGLFSVYPTIMEMISVLIGTDMQGTSTIGLQGSEYGYTIVNFVMMYLIGCEIRDREEEPDNKEMKPLALILLLVVHTLILFAWLRIERENLIKDPTILSMPYRYQNPLVISEAVLYFLLFKQIDLGSSRVINSLAAATFPAYLIHLNLLGYCRIPEVVTKSTPIVIAHVAGCIVGIYLISWVIYTVYSLGANPLLRLIDQKWERKRFYTAE